MLYLYKHQIKSKVIKPQLATLLLIGIVLLAAGIAILWATGIGVGDIFAYLNLLQEQLFMWVEAPMLMSRFLLLPAIAVFILVFIITKVSPQPRLWSRFLIVKLVAMLFCLSGQWKRKNTPGELYFFMVAS